MEWHFKWWMDIVLEIKLQANERQQAEVANLWGGKQEESESVLNSVYLLKVGNCRNHFAFPNHWKYCLAFFAMFLDVPCKYKRYRSPAPAQRLHSPRDKVSAHAYLLSTPLLSLTNIWRGRTRGSGNQNHHRKEPMTACLESVYLPKCTVTATTRDETYCWHFPLPFCKGGCSLLVPYPAVLYGASFGPAFLASQKYCLCKRLVLHQSAVTSSHRQE